MDDVMMDARGSSAVLVVVDDPDIVEAVTAWTTLDASTGTLRGGAFAVRTRPYGREQLRAALRRAIRVKALVRHTESIVTVTALAHAHQWRGRRVHAIVHRSPADGRLHPAHCPPIDSAVTEGHPHTVTDCWRRNGTAVRVDHISTPLHEGGRTVGGAWCSERRTGSGRDP